MATYYCPECEAVRMMDRVWPEDATVGQLAWRISETTAARGVDLFAVEDCGLSAAEWAEMTGRDRSTVARNVRRATAE